MALGVEVKKCPYCAEEIQPDALKCRHCGEWLNRGKEPTPSATNRERSGNTGVEWALVAAGVLMAIGSFLPWIHESTGLITLDRNGFQLGSNLSFSIDGLAQLIFGLIVVVIGVTRLTNTPFPPLVQRSPIVLGVAASFVTIVNAFSLPAQTHVSATIGYGLWVSLIGAVGTMVFGIADWWTSRTAGSTQPSTLGAIGQVLPAIRDCPSCGRQISSIVKSCPYCYNKVGDSRASAS